MAALLEPNQVGKREELADFIAVVDQKSTPFTSMAPKGKDLGNTYFSWQVDDYASPALGGTVDGADVSSYTNPATHRTRLYNYAQVFRREFRVGFLAEQSNVAGVSSEVARGISKKLVEIKRDMEATFTCTNQAYQADNGTNPYLTSSLGKWLTSTDSGGIGAPTSTFAPNTSAVTTTNTDAMTETTVQNVLLGIYTNTGVIRDYDVLAGTTLKRAFTNLTQSGVTISSTTSGANAPSATAVRTFSKDLDDSTFKSVIDVFQGDFGTLMIHPTVFINGSNAGTYTALPYKGYVLPMENVEIRYGSLPNVQELPNAGGGPIRLIQAVAGLCVKNPASCGMFNGAQ